MNRGLAAVAGLDAYPERFQKWYEHVSDEVDRDLAGEASF